MQWRCKAIVDGSGVLYDPAGLNRVELRRLAKQRLPVKHFDRSLLKRLGSTLPRRRRVQWVLWILGSFKAAKDWRLPCCRG